MTDPSDTSAQGAPIRQRDVKGASALRRIQFWLPILGGVVILGLGVSPVGGMIARNWDSFSFTPHAPDWALLSEQSLAVKIHLLAALTALVLGIVMFIRRKGTRSHKTLGWGWVALMMITAGTSLFITEINRDSYSPIHLISGWTLVTLPLAVYAARRGKTRRHQMAMTGLFVGGMIVAGAFAFLPGRFMYDFLIG